MKNNNLPPEQNPQLRPVGFEPTRFGETVGLKSTPLDHSGRSAKQVVFRWRKHNDRKYIIINFLIARSVVIT